MRSNIEGADRSRVWGWAWNPAAPSARVRVSVTVDGAPVGEAVAQTHRPDLEAAGLGDGGAAFSFRFPAPLGSLRDHEVRVLADGADLHGSPIRLPGTASLAPETLDTLRGAIRGAFAAAFGQAQLDQLAGVLAAEAEAALAVPGWARLPAPAALVIDDRLPRADRDAGSQAVLSHMASLLRLGYRVVFVASSDAAPADAEAQAALEAMGVRCLDRVAVGGAGGALRALRGALDVIYLHRLSNAARWLAEARAWCPGARIVYSVAELGHLLLQRMAAFRPPPEDPARIRAAELAAAAEADVVVTHSLLEARLLRDALPGAGVACVPWEVRPRPVAAGFAARRGVAYVGSFAQHHDQDAAELLLREIMPRVHTVDPAIPCLIAGSSIPDAILAMAGPGVEFLGRIPDIADLYARARLSVAPLRFAAGMKGKILESMAFGVPCITSAVAVDGMPDPGGALCLAEGAEATAAAILRLHADAAAAQAQAAAALEWIAAHLAPERIDAAMRAALAAGAPAGQAAGVSAPA